MDYNVLTAVGRDAPDDPVKQQQQRLAQLTGSHDRFADPTWVAVPPQCGKSSGVLPQPQVVLPLTQARLTEFDAQNMPRTLVSDDWAGRMRRSLGELYLRPGVHQLHRMFPSQQEDFFM